MCVFVCVRACVRGCVRVVCLSFRFNEWKQCFLLIFVSYIKRCLFADVKRVLVVGMRKEVSNDKEVNILN